MKNTKGRARKKTPWVLIGLAGWLAMSHPTRAQTPDPALPPAASTAQSPQPTPTPSSAAPPAAPSPAQPPEAPSAPSSAQPAEPAASTAPPEEAPAAPGAEVTVPPSSPAPETRRKKLWLEIGNAIAVRDVVIQRTKAPNEGEDTEPTNTTTSVERISGKSYKITITNPTPYLFFVNNLEIASLATTAEEEPFRFRPLGALASGTSRDFYLELLEPPNFAAKTVSAAVLGYFELAKDDPKQRQGLRQAFPLLLQNPELQTMRCIEFEAAKGEKPQLDFWTAVRKLAFARRRRITCTNGFLVPMNVTFHSKNPRFFFPATDATTVPVEPLQTVVKTAVSPTETFSLDVAYDPGNKAEAVEGTLTMVVEPASSHPDISKSSQELALVGQTFASPARWNLDPPRGGPLQKDPASQLPLIDFGKMAQNELARWKATITVWNYSPFTFRTDKPLQFSLSGPDADNFVVTKVPDLSVEGTSVFTITMKPGLQMGATPSAKLQFAGALEDKETPKYNQPISFAFHLQGLVEKPIHNQGKIVLGQVTQGKEFPLPVALPVVLTKQVPFAARVVDKQGNPLPGIRVWPADEKEATVAWDGKALRFTTTPEAQQDLDATFELRVGAPANPEIYRWILQGKIISIVEQKPLDLGELMPGSDRRRELQWPAPSSPDSVLTSWAATIQSMKPNDFRWLSLPRYGASLSSGSLDPLFIDYEAPSKGHRGETLTGRIFAEITMSDQKKTFVSYPVSLRVSAKTPWVLDASMSLLAQNSYHTSIPCYPCGSSNQTIPSGAFSTWSSLWMNRVNASYALPTGRYLEKGTHVEARPGLTVMGALSSDTRMVGIGVQVGLTIYPGDQRFLQLHLLPFVEYRFVEIPQIMVAPDGTWVPSEATGQSRVAGGFQFNALVDLGKWIRTAHGWSVGGGFQLSGMYAPGGAYGAYVPPGQRVSSGDKADVGTLEAGGNLVVQKRFGF